MSRLFSYTWPSSPGNVAFDIQPTNIAAAKVAEVRWTVLGLYFILVCDATVANRTLVVKHYDTSKSTPMGFRLLGPTAAATQTKTHDIGSMTVLSNMTSQADAYANGLPLITDFTHSIHVSVINGVAGDAVTGLALVLEEPA